jgi:FSR family fosmidomycin resistance protein-like MFS transporter
MFHVGGGIDVLNISNKKAALSGIFVSTGAMGIFLGGKSASVGFDKYFIIVLILLFCAILLFWLYNQIKDKVKNEEVIAPKININEMISIICLMITVVIRGYVGLILSFEWKSNFILALLSIFAVVFGKMLGGIIGDRIGFMKISLISLIVSAFLFIFAFDNSILGILAILFFNMTMPITLTALSNILFNNKGMAFGLLTFALFIGAVPVFLGYTDVIFSSIGLFFTTIISAVILYIGVKKYNKFMEKQA